MERYKETWVSEGSWFFRELIYRCKGLRTNYGSVNILDIEISLNRKLHLEFVRRMIYHRVMDAGIRVRPKVLQPFLRSAVSHKPGQLL